MQRTNIYLDEDQVRALKHLAAEHEQSVASLFRRAVDDYLSRGFARDDLRQQRMTDLLDRIRSRSQSEVDPEEIETDISLAREEEVRTARRASRGTRQLTPIYGCRRC